MVCRESVRFLSHEDMTFPKVARLPKVIKIKTRTRTFARLMATRTLLFGFLNEIGRVSTTGVARDVSLQNRLNEVEAYEHCLPH